MPEPTANPPVAPSRLRRLPGRTPTVRASRNAARVRLWLDGTQLVQESVRGYTQEIQRFALADIQAIQIRRTVRGLVYNVILGVLLALPLFGLVTQLASQRRSVGDLLALAIIAGVFGLLLLVNTLRGPTCRTVLMTALGPQPLPSLCRMRVARRTLDMIAPNIEAIQGALPPDEAVRMVDNTRSPVPAPGATARPSYDY